MSSTEHEKLVKTHSNFIRKSVAYKKTAFPLLVANDQPLPTTAAEIICFLFFFPLIFSNTPNGISVPY